MPARRVSQLRRSIGRSGARLLTALVALGALLGGCGAPSRLTVTIVRGDAALVPEHLEFSWTAPNGAALAGRRLPTEGPLPTTGEILATVVVDLDEGLEGDRVASVTAFGGGAPLARAAARVPVGSGAPDEIRLVLRAGIFDDPPPAPDPAADGAPPARPVDGGAPADAAVDAAAADAPPADGSAAADAPPPVVDAAPADGRPILDAPPADAGRSPADAAPPPCTAAHPQALFCEDFEGTWPPTAEGYRVQSGPGSTLAVSRAQVAQGAASLQAIAPLDAMGIGYARGVRHPAPAVTSGALHVRARLFVPSGAAVQGTGWLTLLRLGEAPSTTNKFSLDLVAGDLLQIGGNLAGVYPRSTTALPRDRWVCLELAVKIDRAGGAGYAEAFVDGASVVRTTTGILTLPPAGYADFQFGVVHATQLSAAPSIFVDDVVVRAGPIGCR